MFTVARKNGYIGCKDKHFLDMGQEKQRKISKNIVVLPIFFSVFPYC